MLLSYDSISAERKKKGVSEEVITKTKEMGEERYNIGVDDQYKQAGAVLKLAVPSICLMSSDFGGDVLQDK